MARRRRRTKPAHRVAAAAHAALAPAGAGPPRRRTASAPLATWQTDPAAVYASALQRLPNPDPVLRRLGRAQDVYEAIGYDPHVIGELRAIRAGLLGFEWRIVPGGEGRAARRAAALAEQVLARPPSPGLGWPDVVWQTASAVFTGYAVHEVTWRREGGALVPAAVIDRPARRFTFAPDRSLRLLTRRSPFHGEAVPPRRFLVTRHMASNDNPYGIAVFSACFWPYTFKHGGFRYFVRYCEKHGLPWVVGKYPGSQDARAADELVEQLQRLVVDAVAAVPDDTDLVLESPKSSGVSLPQERLINLCNRELSKALTSQTLATEIQGQASRSASETHRGRERAVNQADRQIVSGTLGTLFRWLTDLNFGEDVAAPRHEFYEEDEARQGWAELFDTARRYLPISRAQAYERLGLTPPADGEELLADGAGGSEPALAMRRGAAAEFAAGEENDPLEQALDAAVAVGGDPEQVEPVAEALARPLVEAAGADPEMLLGRLAERYPDLDAGGLEDLLARVTFAAETWGRLAGAESDA